MLLILMRELQIARGTSLPVGTMGTGQVQWPEFHLYILMWVGPCVDFCWITTCVAESGGSPCCNHVKRSFWHKYLGMIRACGLSMWGPRGRFCLSRYPICNGSAAPPVWTA